jgi:hypothetical protein
MKTHVLYLYLVLLFPFGALAQGSIKRSGLSLDTIRVEGRVGLAITIKDLPGQRFVLEIPEVFILRDFKNGLFNYNNQVWNYTRKGAEMNFEDEQYKYSIKLRTRRSRKDVSVKWDMAFRNKTDKSLYDLTAFNCWTMNTAPLFKDLNMERTFVHDSSGRELLLRDVRKTQGDGRRTMQFYSSVEGIDLSKSPWASQWTVSSNQPLSGKQISVVSTDSSWIFENKVDGQVAYFFNNWEQDHGCVHASPLLANELKPGASARAKGSFTFRKLSDNGNLKL